MADFYREQAETLATTHEQAVMNLASLLRSLSEAGSSAADSSVGERQGRQPASENDSGREEETVREALPWYALGDWSPSDPLLRHRFSGDPWGPCTRCKHPAYHEIHHELDLDAASVAAACPSEERDA